MTITSNDLRYYLRMSDSTLRTWRLLGMPHNVLKKGYSYDTDAIHDWLRDMSLKDTKYIKYLRRMDMAIEEQELRHRCWF